MMSIILLINIGKIISVYIIDVPFLPSMSSKGENKAVKDGCDKNNANVCACV